MDAGGWRRLTGAAVLGIAAAAGAPDLGAGQAPEPAPPIAARIHAYLSSYEPELSALVADERFEQEIRRTTVRGSETSFGSVVGLKPERRVLQSEIGFLRLPGDLGWLAQRQVVTVDGKAAGAVAGQLPALYARGGNDLLQHAARIAADNATHNLGNPRSINVPTLPLELLDARHAAAFVVTAARPSQRDGRMVQRVTFVERPPGRLVAYTERQFLLSRVEAVVVEATGAVLEAEVTLTMPQRRIPPHRLTVEFTALPGSPLLVPTRLIERFVAGGTGTGVATYGNYRRFATGARLVP
jgi:hypothetical protein